MSSRIFASLFALLPIFAQADYPGTPLEWSGCGIDTFCATLEFCKDGSNYGYRKPGDQGACGALPGPLIRMNPGNTYKLTLHNTASDPTVLTNLHTHGLHIDGSGDGDNVFRKVGGGSCLRYTWDIPADHPGGTNWYHPHYHTLTNEQTSGGAFGMLIIEDNQNDISSWARIPNEKILQISDTGSLLGNGLSNEIVQVETGKWYRLRVSVVTPGAKPSDVGFVGGDCTVYKVASDGVWHTQPLDSYPGNAFELTGASRADFAIKCSSVGSTDITWGNGIAATLLSGSFGSGTGSDETSLGTAPAKPYSLSDIAEVSVPSANFYDISLSGAKINGQTYSEEVGLGEIAFDEVHEWTISGSGAHPFHTHLYHMLIVSPGGCGAHKEGEFYDTLSASGSCIVRFKTADIGQRMVLHCHVLSHEDNGAINFMDVVGNIPNPNNVDDPAYTCSAAPPPGGPQVTPAPTEPPATPAPTTAEPIVTPGPTPADNTGVCPSTCTTNSDCCSNNCKNGTCKGSNNPPETPAPTPVPTPVPAPVPTPAPVPICPSTCSTNSDCCSNNCKKGQCKGNRFLRAMGNPV